MRNIIVGLVAGMVVAFGLVVLLMPSMMIVEHESKYKTLDETVNALVVSIKENGWSVAGKIRNMNKTIEKNGMSMDLQVRLVELCKAEYAKDIIESNPEISTMMPCSWGVYERADGKIYISGMNMGLMGKMFGGNIAKVVGESVGNDEHKILSAVIK